MEPNGVFAFSPHPQTNLMPCLDVSLTSLTGRLLLLNPGLTPVYKGAEFAGAYKTVDYHPKIRSHLLSHSCDLIRCGRIFQRRPTDIVEVADHQDADVHVDATILVVEITI